MNFFQPIVNNPNASFETVKKQRVAWNKGLFGDKNPQTGSHRPRQGILMKQYWAKNKQSQSGRKNRKGCAPSHTTYVYHTPAGIFNQRSQAMTANDVTQFQLEYRCDSKNYPDWFRVRKEAQA